MADTTIRLFPLSSVYPFANFPDRISVISSKSPIIIHEALAPLLLLFLTLLLQPKKTLLRNSIALPVIVGLYIRLSILYTSSHWGFAFCVGAYTYYGSLQAFNLLVVKDVGRDEDVRWKVDDTKENPEEKRAMANGVANGAVTGESKSTNGAAPAHGNGSVDDKEDSKSSGSSQSGLGYPDLSTYPLWQRIRFTTSLITSSRGVGWKFQVRQVPPGPPTSTSLIYFVSLHTFWILFTFLYLDFYGWFSHHDPYFKNHDCWYSAVHVTPLSKSKWNAICLPEAVPRDNALAIFIYHNVIRKHVSLFAVFAILSQLFSIAAVLLTLYLPVTKPYSWAPLFGSITSATSLRGFWTVFWHSIFKKGFSYPSEWLAFRVLKLDRKSIPAQAILVAGAFINSGALHGLGCYTLCGRWSSAGGFFLLQPLGFLGEGLILLFLKKIKLDSKSAFGKLLTTTWMMIWLLWSCEVFFYDFLKAGAVNTEPVIWSIWRWRNGDPPLRWDNPKVWLRWDENSLGGWGLRL